MSDHRWRTRHDWHFEPIVLASYPPQYRATCARCGERKTGFTESFYKADCAGLVTQTGTSVPTDSDDQQNVGSKPEALGYHVSNPPEEWKKVDFR